jgi:hypothetical protein
MSKRVPRAGPGGKACEEIVRRLSTEVTPGPRSETPPRGLLQLVESTRGKLSKWVFRKQFDLGGLSVAHRLVGTHEARPQDSLKRTDLIFLASESARSYLRLLIAFSSRKNLQFAP